MSCSGDGMIYHTDIITAQETSSNSFDCHDGAVYEVCMSWLKCRYFEYHSTDFSRTSSLQYGAQKS